MSTVFFSIASGLLIVVPQGFFLLWFLILLVSFSMIAVMRERVVAYRRQRFIQDTQYRREEFQQGKQFLRQQRILKQYNKSISTVSFSPDGLLVAVATLEDIELLDVTTGRHLHYLKGHKGSIYWLVFSSNSRILTSVSYDNTIHFWNTVSGRSLDSFSWGIERKMTVATSPDKNIWASGEQGNDIRLWDVSKGRHLYTLTGHKGKVTTLAFSPNGMLLVSGGEDAQICLWDVYSGRMIRLLLGHTKRINTLMFSPSGKQLASGSDDNTVRIWMLGDILRQVEQIRTDEENCQKQLCYLIEQSTRQEQKIEIYQEELIKRQEEDQRRQEEIIRQRQYEQARKQQQQKQYEQAARKQQQQRQYEEVRRQQQQKQYEEARKQQQQKQYEQARKQQRTYISPKKPQMTQKTAYKILQLSETATQEEIKSTYYRLMKKNHPDQGGSDYLAKQINEAYEVLRR